MNTNSDYLAGMRSHFKQWDEAVDVLAAEGRRADGEARTAYQRRLKELRLARNDARRSFETLRTASGDAAVQSQAGLERAWETMQQALRKVSTDLHTPPCIPQPSPEPEPRIAVDDAPAVAHPTASPVAPAQEAMS